MVVLTYSMENIPSDTNGITYRLWCTRSIFNIVYSRDTEPVARVPAMVRGKVSLARGIHRCPNIFCSYFPRPASLYCAEHAYIDTHI